MFWSASTPQARRPLRSTNVARWVSLVLLAAVVGQTSLTAYWLIRLARPLPAESSRFTIAIDQARSGAASSVEAIVSSHLFGSPPISKPPEEPAAQVPMPALVGTIAVGQSGDGFAILSGEATPSHLYAVGSEVSKSVTLRAVYADHVVLDRSGQLQVLTLPRRNIGELAGKEAEVTSASEGGSQPGTPDLEQIFAAENALVGSVLTERPLMSDGVFRGLKVGPGTDPSMLERIGLRPNDVLMGVNGVLMTPEHLAVLRNALASGRKVQFTVMRPPGSQFDISVDTGTMEVVQD